MTRITPTVFTLAIGLAAAGPGLAEGWYMTGNAGGARIDVEVDGFGTLETETGYGGGATLGFLSRDDIRLEIDVAHHRSRISERRIDGHVRTTAALVRGLYEFRTQSEQFRPHVGLGVGSVNLNVDATGRGVNAAFRGNENDWTVAYTAQAGVRYIFEDYGPDIVAQYRFVGTGEAELAGLPGEVDAELHILEAGVRLPF